MSAVAPSSSSSSSSHYSEQMNACKGALSQSYENVQKEIAELSTQVASLDAQIKLKNRSIEPLRPEVQKLKAQAEAFKKDAEEWRSAKKEYEANDLSSIEAVRSITDARTQEEDSDDFDWNPKLLNPAIAQLQKISTIRETMTKLEDAWKGYDKNLLPSKEKELNTLESDLKKLSDKHSTTQNRHKSLEQTAQRINDLIQAFQNNLTLQLKEETIRTGISILENRINSLDVDLGTFTKEMQDWENSPKVVGIKSLLPKLEARKACVEAKAKIDTQIQSIDKQITAAHLAISTADVNIKKVQQTIDGHVNSMKLSYEELSGLYDKNEDRTYQKLLLKLNGYKDTKKENEEASGRLQNKKLDFITQGTRYDQIFTKLNSEILGIKITEKDIVDFKEKETQNKQKQAKFDFEMTALAAGIKALNQLNTQQSVSEQNKKDTSPPAPKPMSERIIPITVPPNNAHTNGKKRKSTDEAQVKSADASPPAVDLNKSRKTDTSKAPTDNRDLTQVTPQVPTFPEGSLHALILNGSDLQIKINNPDEAINGWTPMLLLALRGDIDTFLGFIKMYKPKLNATTPEKFNALQLCCFNPLMNDAKKFEDVIETLTVELDVNEPVDRPPLYIAAAKGHSRMVEAFDELGGSVLLPSDHDRVGMTAAHYAAMNKDDISLGHIIGMKRYNPFVWSKGKTVLELLEKEFPNSTHINTLRTKALNKSFFTQPSLSVLTNNNSRRKK